MCPTIQPLGVQLSHLSARGAIDDDAVWGGGSGDMLEERARSTVFWSTLGAFSLGSHIALSARKEVLL